ncbi:TetR/AcrR family transcriptional regulator [Bacillus pumilus]|uniref:TetR/AcrR family transcriptional regulator n=1 Tax=Bacillus pumilus TaxID=1408 RepID=UPI00273F77E0|nr:TetR/AcrR family transcriptional regulator [Bacillus pumilus]WLP61294.1 TetR/AcrR family transcriptional regulator [Bacillus pumilus]
MSKTKKEQIFDAAARTILVEGLSQLTLQQVAEHAHMTKAGLLYHFASKEELIQKMNEHAILCFRQQLETYQETYKHEKAPYVRAYISATLHDLDHQNTIQLCTSMLATMSFDEALLNPWRNFYAEFKAKAAEEINDPALSQLIRLACDGIWFSEMFQLEPLNQEEKTLLLHRILHLLEEGT